MNHNHRNNFEYTNFQPMPQNFHRPSREINHPDTFIGSREEQKSFSQSKNQYNSQNPQPMDFNNFPNFKLENSQKAPSNFNPVARTSRVTEELVPDQYRNQSQSKANSSIKNIETGGEVTFSKNLYSTPGKTDFVHDKSRVEDQSESKSNLSWTKYIGMELKNDELLKKLESQEADIKQKGEKILQLEKLLVENRRQNESIRGELETRHEKKLYDSKNEYVNTIAQKNEKIKELADKIVDETRNGIADEIKTYISETLAKNVELTAIVESAASERIENSRKINKLEQQLSVSEANVKRLESSVSVLSKEIDQITQKFMSRSITTPDSSTYAQVIQSQTSQIAELTSLVSSLQVEKNRLRTSEVELTNKLNSIQKEHEKEIKKRIAEKDQIITDLGFTLTQKNFEIVAAQRQAETSKGRYNVALEELKDKNNFISAMRNRPRNEFEVKEVLDLLEQILNRIRTWNPVQYSNVEEINKLKRRIVLLEN